MVGAGKRKKNSPCNICGKYIQANVKTVCCDVDDNWVHIKVYLQVNMLNCARTITISLSFATKLKASLSFARKLKATFLGVSTYALAGFNMGGTQYWDKIQYVTMMAKIALAIIVSTTIHSTSLRLA